MQSSLTEIAPEFSWWHRNQTKTCTTSTPIPHITIIHPSIHTIYVYTLISKTNIYIYVHIYIYITDSRILITRFFFVKFHTNISLCNLACISALSFDCHCAWYDERQCDTNGNVIITVCMSFFQRVITFKCNLAIHQQGVNSHKLVCVMSWCETDLSSS